MESKQGIHVMTLANSIIGVSILAMPYCFKQCGIVLSIILLIFSSILSRLACHFLLKSAIKARLRTFEFLAYHIFGSLGKLFVEIGMIGFLIGTCIAFFVVMGDLGPQIVAHMTDTESSDTLRTTILVALAIFCVLPLGLLKNVDSLSGVCTATIGFYGCLVLKIMGESASHILVGDWVDTVNYWRPAGILQCIPIFSMALFCQTQLFEIYQAIPNASLEKMNNLVRLAVNICTCVYIFVGIFGYIAISHEGNFTGNILMNFKPSIMTEVMKIGFVLSVAFSFPLVIFPCRASLYSLLYKPTYSALHESTSFYIPEGKFRILTFLIVLVSLIIGVMIPNIELVLGLVGSTIGVMICVLFPATCFICLTSKNTNERILAQIMLFVGVIMMVLGTYANLYAMEQVTHGIATEKPVVIVDLAVKQIEEKIPVTTVNNLIEKHPDSPNKEIRHEPPQPEAPPEDAQAVIKETKMDPALDLLKKPPELLPEVQVNVIDLNASNKQAPVQETPRKSDDLIEIVPVAKEPQISKEKVPNLKTDEIDKEAIKKEDKELEQGNLNLEQQDLYEKQHRIIAEQQKLLEQIKLKDEKKLKEREEVLHNQKLKLVKNIETFAKLAIESLVDDKVKMDQQIINQTNIGLNPDQNLLNQGNEALKKLAPIPLALAPNIINKQQLNLNKVTISDKTPAEVNTDNLIFKQNNKEVVELNIKQKDTVNVLSLLKGETVKNNEKVDISSSRNTTTKPQEIKAESAKTVEIPKNAVSPIVEHMKKLNETMNRKPMEKESLVVTSASKDVKSEKVDEDKIAGNHRDILSEDNYLRRKRDALANTTEEIKQEVGRNINANLIEDKGIIKTDLLEQLNINDNLMGDIGDSKTDLEGQGNINDNIIRDVGVSKIDLQGQGNKVSVEDNNVVSHNIYKERTSTERSQKEAKLDGENNQIIDNEHCQKDHRSEDLIPNKSTDLKTPKNLPKAIANEV